MQTALNILGCRCYHSLLWFSTNIGDTKMWNEALDAKYFNKGTPFTRVEWDQLLHDFGAACEVPTCAFAEELIEAYPEAKVVLVSRDIDRWYSSFDKAVIQNMWNFWLNRIADIDPWFMGPMRNTHDRWARGWLNSHSADEMRAKAKDNYRKHYALVRRVTPKERLLEFKLSDGWPPLCEFLGKPVPDVPFPQINEQEWLNEKIGLLARRGLKKVATTAVTYLTPVVVVGLAWRFYGNRVSQDIHR
ncbi:MAG: hypothetical protein Q9187_000341 [Circinaria calcarea]